MTTIRLAKDEDFPQIWLILTDIISAGDSYVFPADTSYEMAYAIWMRRPLKCFVAEGAGKILGSYVIKENHIGRGSHVCNCSYVVSNEARGEGIGGKMCKHSQETARELGFKAMQYNLVVSSNEAAIHLWQKHGFEIVGTLPKAFEHAEDGYIDAHIMYKWLS